MSILLSYIIYLRGTIAQYESLRSGQPGCVTFNLRNLRMACSPSTRFGNLGMLIIVTLYSGSARHSFLGQSPSIPHLSVNLLLGCPLMFSSSS